MTELEKIAAVLQAVRCLIVMEFNHDDLPIIGGVGYDQLRAALIQLEDRVILPRRPGSRQ